MTQSIEVLNWALKKTTNEHTVFIDSNVSKSHKNCIAAKPKQCDHFRKIELSYNDITIAQKTFCWLFFILEKDYETKEVVRRSFKYLLFPRFTCERISRAKTVGLCLVAIETSSRPMRLAVVISLTAIYCSYVRISYDVRDRSTDYRKVRVSSIRNDCYSNKLSSIVSAASEAEHYS